MAGGVSTPSGRQGEVMANHLEDIVAAALVQRGGLQIGLEPQQNVSGKMVGGEVTMALLHPEVGRLNHPRHHRLVEDMGLGTLAFCRCMAKVMAFQKELGLRGKSMICTVAAPTELLLDARQLQRIIHWLAERKFRPNGVRLRFSRLTPAALSNHMFEGTKLLIESGFGVAVDLRDLDTEFGALMREMCDATVLVDRAAVANVTGAGGDRRLAKQLSAIADSGTQIVALEVEDEPAHQQAIAVGIKVLQSSRFAIPTHIGRALRAANTR